MRRARPQPDPLDALLGDVRVDDQLVVARTIRTRLLAIPGRIVNRAGRPTLRTPTHWPWADQFATALTLYATFNRCHG